MTAKITTTDELASADYDRIEYANIRVKKGDPADYYAGRIVGRWNSDIDVRYRGHTYTVSNITEWTLLEYEPVTSQGEKMLIESEWSE